MEDVALRNGDALDAEGLVLIEVRDLAFADDVEAERALGNLEGDVRARPDLAELDDERIGHGLHGLARLLPSLLLRGRLRSRSALHR